MCDKMTNVKADLFLLNTNSDDGRIKSILRIDGMNYEGYASQQEDGMHVYVLSLDKTFVFNEGRINEI